MKAVINFIKNEVVLSVAALLALVSAFFVPPDTEYIGYINFRVLVLLFALMTVVSGLRGMGVLDYMAGSLAKKCSSLRTMVILLTAICFFTSMVITNDVALITFVPLAIAMLTAVGGEKYIIFTVVMQTVAANMGSMLTPMGNPQNLYLSDTYGMSTAEFFSATLPLCLVSGILIFASCLYVKGDKISINKGKTDFKADKKLLIVYAVVGIASILAVFNVISYIIAGVLALVFALIFDRAALKRVDWLLLLTFTAFFIFVGNVGRIEAVKDLMSSIVKGREILVGAFLSQFISNVPAALMLSAFTDNGVGLMIGVDLGGLGTPVASLASLISLRLYNRSCSEKGKYMLTFLGVNFAFLIILGLFCMIYY